MDFKFDLTKLFKKDITKIDNRLVPEGFSGDKRSLNNCVNAVSEIIDSMGLASAKAQGLQKPITNADRLRNSDYLLYLFIDFEGNDGYGSIVGLLKTGWKKLYVFDRSGECHHKLALCVLDFYIHESRQRQGCGKLLFEYMLNEEDFDPEKLAIDRPSDKFLQFLQKHYGLEKIVPQTNNFVVFEGFFPSRTQEISEGNRSSASMTRKYGDNPYPYSSRNSLVSGGDSVTYNGRYAAHKPETTIGKCLSWHTPMPKTTQGNVLALYSGFRHTPNRPHRNATSILSPFATSW